MTPKDFARVMNEYMRVKPDWSMLRQVTKEMENLIEYEVLD